MHILILGSQAGVGIELLAALQADGHWITSANASAGLELSRFDAALVGGNAAGLARALRCRGYASPIIAMGEAGLDIGALQLAGVNIAMAAPVRVTDLVSAIDRARFELEQGSSKEYAYGAMLDVIPMAVMGCDAAGMVLYANQAAATLCDSAAGLLVGHSFHRVFPKASIAWLNTAQPSGRPDMQTIQRERSGALDVEVFRNRAQIADDHSIILLSFREQVRDSQSQRRIDYLTQHDPLTGVLNSQSFRAKLQDLLNITARNKHTLALMVVGVDQISQINAQHGRTAGDAVLTHVATQLLENTRNTDIVGRLNGRDFIVALYRPGNVEAVEHLARQYCRAVAQAIRHQGRMLTVTASAGSAHFLEDAVTMDDLIIYAEMAKAVAEDTGGNKHLSYQGAMQPVGVA